METSDLAANLVSMNFAKTQFSTNIEILRQQIDTDKIAATLLDNSSRRAPAPAGTGLIVDKSA